jgi:hypothetical protein
MQTAGSDGRVTGWTPDEGLTTPHEEKEWYGRYKILHRDSDRALVNAAMSLQTP